MSSLTQLHTDIRQTEQWATYMTNMGWTVEKIDGIYIFIRRVYPFKHSLIKISHPKGPIPFEKIEELSKKHKALFTIIEPHIEGYQEEEYKKNRFEKSILKSAFTATRLLDLQKTEQELWESLSENARRNIKKAQKNNMTIKRVMMKDETDWNNFDNYFNLYVHLGKKKNFYTQSHQESLTRMKAFKENTFLYFAYEKENPDPIATIWFSFVDNTLVYMLTGITNKGYELLANYILAWEGIKTGRELGLKVFDFESVFDERYP
jgi:lipid II:glycine glycyltransferase (peptidoglycan interpeptide bridge formation enzyme)